ncbi:tripartite tricarboxylate transporter substrate binding protein [Curvibacter fontanus]|jgi:tripartite-type tricarboxylate transporter receptor subunit TctC
MRKILTLALAGLALLQSPLAQAQAGGAITRIISPFAAGGAREVLARTFYQEFGSAMGQTVIIESKPGAGGAIGTVFVGRAEPDGRTLLMAASSHFVTAATGAKPVYDPIKEFVPVAEIGTQNYVFIISAALPTKNVTEFVRYAKQHAGELNYGSAGVGSSTHLAMAYFISVAGIDMLHVPYKSTQEAANDVIGGRAHAVIVPSAGVVAYANNPKLRIIGVTSKTRSALLPNVPAIAQDGLPAYEFESWFGVLAPAGTPPVLVEKLNTAINKALANPEVKTRLAAQGVTPVPGSAAAFNKVFLADHALMNRVVKDAKLTAE